MQFDFDTVQSRTGTDSFKWSRYDRQILPMWIADMDFRSPPRVVEALQARAAHSIFGYADAPQETIDAVLNYLQRVHGYTAEEEWLVWLPGLVPAINTCCRAFAVRDETILTSTPVYPPFLTAPGNSYRVLIDVPLVQRAGDGRATFDFEGLEKAVQENSRAFLLCNPHNPVGRVYDKAELQQLAAFCQRHDLVIVSDEIHCDLILEPDTWKHTLMATLSEEVEDRTATLLAPSKTYNLPGLACSFVIIKNPRLRARFKRSMQGMITEVNCFGYAGCAAAYNHGEPWRLELISYLRGNRDYLYEFIQKRIPQIKLKPMEATYLAWMDPSELGLDNPANFFEEHGIALSDGRYFGAPGMLRLNFGCPRATLEEGLQRMEKAVASL